MTRLNRRSFLGTGSAAAAALVIGTEREALAERVAAEPSGERIVRLTGDGLGLTSPQYASLLARLADEKGFSPDSYSLGGVVEELETQFARILGKERAVFMPTGTLANHMAVRALAGTPSRVIVQEQSHFYQDEGDCAQTLSNLTLMPLAPGRATFSANDVQRLLDETKSARVVSRVSAISIETPVRRKAGERFDPVELEKIIRVAQANGIRLHLDGARLFLQAAYTGEDVAKTAAPFDTVYVSLYKYFNAASGAILAGPRDLLDGMFHGRRMFGGGLSQVWPFAAVALHYFAGFGDRYTRAVKTSEEFISGLGKRGGFSVERIPSGTNLFRVKVREADPAAMQKRLAANGVMVSTPQGGAFLVGVNETWNRITAADLTEMFVKAATA